jgi:hypothetical protein
MSSCAPADRLLQTIRVSAPGATDDLITLQLFNVADEFFRRTSAWRHESSVVLHESARDDYSFSVPAGASFVRMMGVTHNGIPVPTTASTQAVQSGAGIVDPTLMFPDGDALYAPDLSDLEGSVFSWSLYRPDYITITGVTAAQVEHPMEMLMALSVARSCLEQDDCGEWNVPEWMWDMFFQDWLDGTLGRLYGMPAKPWSNLPIGSYHGKRFRNAMAYRKQEANRGFVYNAPAAWRFPRWSA